MSFNKYIDNTGALEYKTKSKPMTFVELRARLKEIEVLCASLSIDLANEIELRERLRSERDRANDQSLALMAELTGYRRREYNRQYRKKKQCEATETTSVEEDISRN